MPFPENIGEISALVQAELAGTEFQCSALTPLAGGNANFVFHGQLAQPLKEGTHDVLIKHGEAYASGNQSFEIPISRCVCILRLLLWPHSLTRAGGGIGVSCPAPESECVNQRVV